MRRLLNVNNYHYRRGGAESVYLAHGEMFAAAGWETDWFSMKHPHNPSNVDDTYFADLIDLEHFSGAFHKLRAASAIIYNRNARRQIESLVDASRPDIVHVHNIYHHLSPSILPPLRKRGIPVVLTAHDLKLLCPSYKMISQGAVCEDCKGGNLLNLARKRCLKGSLALSGLITIESMAHRYTRLYSANIDVIVAPSQFYRSKFIEWGWPAEKVRYIPNFVANDGTVRTPVPDHGPVLYFGRLSDEKGLATLIRAAAASGVRVAIAGTGPMEADLKELACAMQAPVDFLGYRSGPDLAAALEVARAIVIPSEWYENAPMSVLEAYAAGRPVLGASIGGIPELISENETGWTFTSGSVEDLASALAKVVDTPSPALTEMGETGAAQIRAEFGQAIYLDRMQSLYRAILSTYHSGRNDGRRLTDRIEKLR